MKRNSLVLLFSQWISVWGNHLHQLALPLLVFQKTGSSGDFALALMAETIPWVVCAPIVTPYLQRFSSKRILVASDVTRAFLCLVIAFYSWSEIELFGLMFLLGTCSSVYGAFRIQTVRSLVPKEGLTRFLALSSGGNEMISMAAPLIGAGLISLGVSAKIFMVVDSLTFFGSFALLSMLGKVLAPVRSETEKKTKNPLQLLGKISWSHSVRAITFSESLRSVAEGLFIPAMLTLMVQVLHLGDSDFAWVRSCMAIAGVLSSYVFVKIADRWSHRRSHTIATVLILLGIVALPQVPGFLAALCMGFVLGLGMSLKQILSDNIVIQASDARFQAETITLINSIVALSYCLGYAVSAHWDQPAAASYLFYGAGVFVFISIFVGLNISPSVQPVDVKEALSEEPAACSVS